MSPRNENDEVEKSGSLDLFGGQQGLPPAIPQMTHVPETREERVRRVALRVTLVAIVVACTILGVFIFLHMKHTSEVEAAIEASLDFGREAAVTEALGLLESDDDAEDHARKALLMAVRDIEHGCCTTAPVKAELAEIEGSTLAPAQLASVYVALLDGETAQAVQLASGIVPSGDWAAEAARVRATVALSVGSLEQALAAARVAVEKKPTSPRHVALLALVTARSGDPAAALAALDAVPRAAEEPAVRLAKARVLADVQHEYPRALTEADAVLGALAATATPVEESWAHLVRARSKVAAGDLRGGLEEARVAREARPTSREAFGLLLAETFLRADALSDASTELGSMSPDFSTDPGRRAQIAGEIALRRGQLDAAAAELGRATAGPFTTLLRARLADARGAYDEAFALYSEAAADPALVRESTTRQAALELARGRVAQANELIDRALEVAPTDPDTVSIAARARLASDRAAQATQLLAGALAAHPNDSILLEARAAVEMAGGEHAAARDSLVSAIEGRPESAPLRAALGDALRNLGAAAEAKAAYEAALERDQASSAALVGLLFIALDAYDAEAARAALAKVDEAGITSRDVHRARARFLVLTAAGQEGLTPVRNAMRTVRNDVELLLSMAQLYLQAGQSSGAATTYTRVLELDSGNVEALIGRALVQAQRRLSGPAKTSVEAAQEAVSAHDPGPVLRARLLAAQGTLALEKRQVGPANRSARRAVEIDPQGAEGHYLLALTLEERNRDPSPEYELAISARVPNVDAMGALSLRLFGPEEGGAVPPRACELARRYLAAAPAGAFAAEVRPRVRACP